MKKSLTACFILTAAVVFIIAGCVKPRTDNIDYYNSHLSTSLSNDSDLIINELCAHSPAFIDSDGTPPVNNHWVELYNASDSTIDFHASQYYLTQDSTKPNMYKLDTFSIASHGYILVMTDSPQLANKEHMHASFHTGKGGGFIGLYKHTSSGYVALTKHIFAAQTSAYSEGRLPDNGKTWYDFALPTPLAPNSANGGATLSVNQ
jgi:hypothetical protein